MVKRITQNEINSLPDFLTNAEFVMMFGSIPGMSSTKRLTLQCKSTAIPGETVERVSETLAGFEKGQAGGRTWSHTLSVTFAETRDLQISKAFRTWMQMCRGTKSGSSMGYSKDYQVDVDIYVFDTAGEMVKSCTIYGVQPTEFPEIGLEGGTSHAVVNVAITFGYNYSSNDENTEL
jgi:hypothetical protein